MYCCYIEEITFDDAPSQQSIAIHTDTLIVCRTSGNPAPEVSWRFKGRRLVDSKCTWPLILSLFKITLCEDAAMAQRRCR